MLECWNVGFALFQYSILPLFLINIKMRKNKIVLLAFSGGLDTTYCAIHLAKEKNMEVHTAVVNTGGFSSEELRKIEKHAYSLGVKKHYTLDETNAYYKECIRFLIY